MTNTLTSNQEAFIAKMCKNSELETKGFNLLSNREDALNYFDTLCEKGFFKPDKIPRIQTSGTTFEIHYWHALTYLKACAEKAHDRSDIAKKLLTIISDISKYPDATGKISSNYHINRVFAEILGLLPLNLIKMKHLRIIKLWLANEYDQNMVIQALTEGLIRNCLQSQDELDWKKSAKIFYYCTSLRKASNIIDDAPQNNLETVASHYWLKNLINTHFLQFGMRIPKCTATILLIRLRRLFANYYNGYSWLIRPAIESHQQNYAWREPENLFIEGLRDILLTWSDKNDEDNFKQFIRSLLKSDLEIASRIAIFVVNTKWELLYDIFDSEILKDKFFTSGYRHELYRLLKDRFSQFSDNQKDLVVEIISDLQQPENSSSNNLSLISTKRDWLSAIVNNGHTKADQLFKQLNSTNSLGKLSEHPDFLSFMISAVGPDISPYQVGELLSFAKNKLLIDKLNRFNNNDPFNGPTVEGLIRAIESAVEADPMLFAGVMMEFQNANSAYQYAVLHAFQRLWNADQSKSTTVDWGFTWEKMIEFIEYLFGRSDFWTQPDASRQSFTPNQTWIPPVIATLLADGSRKDDKLYPGALSNRARSLIGILLEKLEPSVDAENDPMLQSLNSARGKAIEALFCHTLMECRRSDRESGNHTPVWEIVMRLFDREISECKNANFEFSFIAAQYINQIHYINQVWLNDNFKALFPKDCHDNFIFALEGLAYAQDTSPVYKLLRTNQIMEFALTKPSSGPYGKKRLIDRIANAYLSGDECLDGSLFAMLFQKPHYETLASIARYFWSANKIITKNTEIDKIFRFWEKCVSLVDPSPENKLTQLLAQLSWLTCYVDDIDETTLKLLKAVAPHAQADGLNNYFIEGLYRIANKRPDTISHIVNVLDLFLESYTPQYDVQDYLKSLIRIIASRNRSKAIDYASNLSNVSGMALLFKDLTVN
jgi:hypothetical protein